MKLVTVPAPIVPRTIDGKPFVISEEDGSKTEMGEVSMHRYLISYVVNETSIVKDGATDQFVRELKIGRGYEGNKRARKLDKSFEGAATGSAVRVEDADWKVVKKIIEEKQWPSATFGSQFVDFEDAWMNAVEKE